MPNKAVGGGVAGAVTVILVWVLGTFHVEIPPEIASIFTVLISTAMVYIVPHEDA